MSDEEKDHERELNRVRPKDSLSNLLSETFRLRALETSLFTVNEHSKDQTERLYSFHASPKPIGKDVKVVAEVPVASNQSLLENKECVLECLEPLLTRRTTTTGAKQGKSSPPINDSALESFEDTSTNPTFRSKNNTSTEVTAGVGSSCHHRGLPAHQNDGPALKTRKRSRSNSWDAYDVDLTNQQAALWQARYDELASFREIYGHCLVPHKWPENSTLSTWVKRQRHQFKLKYQDRRSTLTDDREQALTTLGFVFDSHSAIWEERFQELVQFKKDNGHTNVPSTHINHRLSVWVQCQRRQWKLLMKDTSSTTGDQLQESATYHLKESRARRLQELGFVWEQRKRCHKG